MAMAVATNRSSSCSARAEVERRGLVGLVAERGLQGGDVLRLVAGDDLHVAADGRADVEVLGGLVQRLLQVLQLEGEVQDARVLRRRGRGRREVGQAGDDDAAGDDRAAGQRGPPQEAPSRGSQQGTAAARRRARPPPRSPAAPRAPPRVVPCRQLPPSPAKGTTLQGLFPPRGGTAGPSRRAAARAPAARSRAARAGGAAGCAGSGESSSRARRWPSKIASAMSRGATQSPMR